MNDELKEAMERLAECIAGKPQFDRWIMQENPQTRQMERIRQVSYCQVTAADILAVCAVAGEASVVKDLELGARTGGKPEREIIVKTRQVGFLLKEAGRVLAEKAPAPVKEEPAAPVKEE